ncbi:MAG TPA: tetratricopeptide repeat protein [Roseiflexaceae bacterium]|nr:tetratricopeptide repeat protein [Roseiflexaceae bacterium]
MVTQTLTPRGGAPVVIDVTEQTFQTDVVERSREVPVVIDFWAPWCGPCRTLGPTLEKLAKEANGAFVLAKVNVDQNPRLAQAFRVQGIPDVKAVRDGKLVDEFTGAMPESQVRAWLKGIVPAEAADPLEQIQAIEEVDPEEAIAHYRLLLGSDPDNAAAQFRLGRLLLTRGSAEGLALLNEVASGTPFFDPAQALLPLADFFAAIGDTPAALAEQIARDPADLEPRYQLAAALARDGQPADALESLLAIVQRDRGFREDGARKAMVGLFAMLGEEHPLVGEYRRRLANALF